VIRGHANMRRAFFEHLDDRSQDARDRPEGQALRRETSQAVIVAKQLVSAVDEVNDHVAQECSRRRPFELLGAMDFRFQDPLCRNERSLLFFRGRNRIKLCRLAMQADGDLSRFAGLETDGRVRCGEQSGR